MKIRSWPLGSGQSFRFDFSISDLDRSGSVPDGITITVITSDEYDGETLVAKADVIARRRAEKLLREALAELRKAPS